MRNRGCMLPQVYDYYCDGELVCTGTALEIAEQTGLDRSYISKLRAKPTKRRCLKLRKRMKYLYEVYDIYDVVHFVGTSVECADYLFIDEHSFVSMVTATKIGKRTGERGGMRARMVGLCSFDLKTHEIEYHYQNVTKN